MTSERATERRRQKEEANQLAGQVALNDQQEFLDGIANGEVVLRYPRKKAWFEFGIGGLGSSAIVIICFVIGVNLLNSSDTMTGSLYIAASASFIYPAWLCSWKMRPVLFGEFVFSSEGFKIRSGTKLIAEIPWITIRSIVNCLLCSTFRIRTSLRSLVLTQGFDNCATVLDAARFMAAANSSRRVEKLSFESLKASIQRSEIVLRRINISWFDWLFLLGMGTSIFLAGLYFLTQTAIEASASWLSAFRSCISLLMVGAGLFLIWLIVDPRRKQDYLSMSHEGVEVRRKGKTTRLNWDAIDKLVCLSNVTREGGGFFLRIFPKKSSKPIEVNELQIGGLITLVLLMSELSGLEVNASQS